MISIYIYFNSWLAIYILIVHIHRDNNYLPLVSLHTPGVNFGIFGYFSNVSNAGYDDLATIVGPLLQVMRETSYLPVHYSTESGLSSQWGDIDLCNEQDVQGTSNSVFGRLFLF